MKLWSTEEFGVSSDCLPQQSGMLEKGNMVILNFYRLSTKAIDFSNQLLIFERQAFTFKRDEFRHGNLMHPPKATPSK